MRSVLFFIYILQILVFVCQSDDDDGLAENIQDLVEKVETTEKTDNLEVELEKEESNIHQTTEKDNENIGTENSDTKDTDAGDISTEGVAADTEDVDQEDTQDEAASGTETVNSNNPTTNRTFVWPVCTAEEGCKPRLNCSNLTEIADEHLRPIVNEQKVVLVTEEQLAEVLSNKTLPCACLLVMFYARWCPYSIAFVPTYNLLGHTLPQLPVLAFDFGANYS